MSVKKQIQMQKSVLTWTFLIRNAGLNEVFGGPEVTHHWGNKERK
jgi:hypothetical protein